jgi:hypothetical protein
VAQALRQFRSWIYHSQIIEGDAAATDAPEAHHLTAMVEARWPDIEAATTTGYSNALSEGDYDLAKHQGCPQERRRKSAKPCG